MGAAEELGKATGSFFDALKSQPLSLALVVMNLALLAFFYFILTTVATHRQQELTRIYDEQKEVRALLAKCIVPTINACYPKGQ